MGRFPLLKFPPRILRLTAIRRYGAAAAPHLSVMATRETSSFTTLLSACCHVCPTPLPDTSSMRWPFILISILESYFSLFCNCMELFPFPEKDCPIICSIRPYIGLLSPCFSTHTHPPSTVRTDPPRAKLPQTRIQTKDAQIAPRKQKNKYALLRG